MHLYILVYLLIINALGYALMLYDKKMAKRRRQRLPEMNFFCVAAVGGSLGCIFGMYTAHHKTRHRSFTIGMPAILLVQILLVVCYLFV